MKYGFFIAIILVFLSLLSYVFVCGGQVLRAFPVGRTVFYISASLLVCAMFAGMLLGALTNLSGLKILAFVGNSAIIIFVYLIISFLLADVIRLILWMFQVSPNVILLFRRYFFLCSLLIIAVSMIIGYIRYINPSITTLSLAAANSTPKGKSLKIVAASDLHLGISNDKQRLKKFVSLINAQNPDIVLFAGDICDNRFEPLAAQKMDEELRQIAAPLGVYAIAGNHEYIAGNVDDKLNFYRQSNIVVLLDSVAQVSDGLYIAGRDDSSNSHRKELRQIVENITPDNAIVLLDHQPHALQQAADNHIALQISGHTHDGQFFPVNLITRLLFEKSQGYLQKNSTHYYIMSGLGIWGPPYRIGTRSELLVVNFEY
ncbi:MAG: metallophosphoesterase [Paludibacter sp.]|jgi:predicted MPP superfamily phosphohydrolase|nr:metallophosphoesterase [Paludibacter sp.]